MNLKAHNFCLKIALIIVQKNSKKGIRDYAPFSVLLLADGKRVM